MLKKIISGGQTGADRAALDVAMKFNIEHGGWIPKGRRTEEGALPAQYQLIEMGTEDYRERTKKNIINSHGTLIISRGELTGGSKLTQSYAKVIGRPNCYIDLLNQEEFEAGIIIKSFIMENQIKILNVAGPRLSHCPSIYQDVKTILEVTLYLLFMDTGRDQGLKACIPEDPVKEEFPKTLEEAVDLICDDLPLRTKTMIAKFEPNDIHMLYFTLMEYLRHRVGFDTGNNELFKACSIEMKTGHRVTIIEDVVMGILKRLKRHLENNYILRVVK